MCNTKKTTFPTPKSNTIHLIYIISWCSFKEIKIVQYFVNVCWRCWSVTSLEKQTGGMTQASITSRKLLSKLCNCAKLCYIEGIYIHFFPSDAYFFILFLIFVNPELPLNLYKLLNVAYFWKYDPLLCSLCTLNIPI